MKIIANFAMFMPDFIVGIFMKELFVIVT